LANDAYWSINIYDKKGEKYERFERNKNWKKLDGGLWRRIKG
jgi:hypothetical protein